MTHSLLLTRCFNTPLLIDTEYLDILSSKVFIKMLSDEEIDRSRPSTESPEVRQPRQNLAVVPIVGTLVNKNGAGASGVASYESTRRKIDSAISNGATDIIFDISSHGGEAHGNFPLAAYINSLPERHGVRTYGFTDSVANSGGYSLLAATQRVFATDMASVGSIGAVASLADVTKMDEKLGVSYEIIRSRDDKQAYNPHEGITKKAIDKATKEIKSWDAKFVSSLLEFRTDKLTEATIDELAGGVVPASEGLKMGLVDEIVASIDEVFTYALTSKGDNSGVKSTKGNVTMTNEELLAQLVEAQTELSNLKSSSSLELQKAIQGERNRCLKIMEAQKVFEISETTVTSVIEKGYDLDMVTTMFTELKATKDEAAAIDTTGSGGNGSVSQAMVSDLQQLATKQKVDEGDSVAGRYTLTEVFDAMADLANEEAGA